MQLRHFKFSGPLGRVERAVNAIIDAVNENRLASGMGYRLKRTAHGTSLDIAVPPAVSEGAPSTILQYRITAISDDYLDCKTWDGTTLGSTTVQIAKPWRLRKTGWDGVTITYLFNGVANPIRYAYNATRPGYRLATHVNNNAVENQAIIPVYSVNDVIYATEPEGGTFLSGVTWLDLNIDARAWARY